MSIRVKNTESGNRYVLRYRDADSYYYDGVDGSRYGTISKKDAINFVTHGLWTIENDEPVETPADKNTKFTFECFNGKQGTAEKDGYDWRVTWPGGYVAYYTTQQVAGYVDRGEWKLLAATMDEDYALTWTFQK